MDRPAATSTYEIAMQMMAIIPYIMRVMAAEIRASEHAAAYSHVAVLGILTARPHTLTELAERNQHAGRARLGAAAA